jgi:hypothetical protein
MNNKQKGIEQEQYMTITLSILTNPLFAGVFPFLHDFITWDGDT